MYCNISGLAAVLVNPMLGRPILKQRTVEERRICLILWILGQCGLTRLRTSWADYCVERIKNVLMLHAPSTRLV